MGVGRIVAPVVIGAAIDLGRSSMPELKGYPIMWPIAGVLMLLGLVALARAMHHARRKGMGPHQSDQREEPT
jgi:hypothetical protein